MMPACNTGDGFVFSNAERGMIPIQKGVRIIVKCRHSNVICPLHNR